jgi:prepilin-type processing-associated H-X9-DG protein
MKKRALTLAELLVVLATIALFMTILLPTLAKIRYNRYRAACAANLSQIGKAMMMYVNDYDDQLPVAAGPNSKWGTTPNYQAHTRRAAFGLDSQDASAQASIGASLYLLVKYEQLTPKSFLCKGDINTTEFIPAKYGVRDKDLIDLWDFGPGPARHCSFSYHIPYGLYALTSSNLPGMAVAADRNPWIDSPSAKAKDFVRFMPTAHIARSARGTAERAKYGNTISHQENGQNVLFIDGHVEFAKRPYCGVEDDNIYTHLPQGHGPPQIGEPPLPFLSQPGHRKDSFLVHDPPIPGKK